MDKEFASAAPAPIELVRPPVDLLLEREVRATTLDSGRWSMTLRGAEIDDITYDGVLVVRSIRLIARDEDWGTLSMHVDRVEPLADLAGNSMRIHGRAGTRGDTCAWTLALAIDGAALTVHARVEVTATFRRNRLGLIVLHPPALAGSALAVEHTDGTVTATVFPERISPHQPAIDIRSLSWRNAPHQNGPAVESTLTFAGDVFEMEDQRNWTDASFKTYSTPLSEPFPVELHPGDVVEQSVELACTAETSTEPAMGAAKADADNGKDPASVRVTFDFEQATAGLPEVTTSVSSGPAPGPPLRATFGPLLCELDPGLPGWPEILDRAATQAGGRPLDLRLILERGEEAEPVLDRIRDSQIAIARLGVFDRRTHVSEPALLAGLRSHMDDRKIEADLLGGTRAHFTELNRNLSRLEEWAGPLAFSITPFMHDRGGSQLVESVAMQRLVVREALVNAHGRALHIGPITLGARFNAVATSTPPPPGSGTIEDGFGAELVAGASDARQAAPSLGAWVLASFTALALPGVSSLSYFEAAGERGLFGIDGHPTSTGVVLQWIAELSGGAVAPLVSGSPAIVGFAARNPADRESVSEWVGIVGNLSDTPLLVKIPGAEEVALEPGTVRRVALSVAGIETASIAGWRAAEG